MDEEAVTEVAVAGAVAAAEDILVATMLHSAEADGKKRPSSHHRRQGFIFYDLIPHRLVDITISRRSGRKYRRYGNCVLKVQIGLSETFGEV